MTKTPIRNLRWYIAVLLCSASVLNYLDRQTLSVLAHTIQHELGWTTQQYSYMTTSFMVSYTVMYAVSGRLIDLLGTARGFTLFLSGWSVVTMLHALGRSVLQLLFLPFPAWRHRAGQFPGRCKGGFRVVSDEGTGAGGRHL